MNKKLALILFSLFDLLFLGGLWIAYHEVNQLFLSINNQTDIIKFGNRIGFFLVGFGIPIVHLAGIIEFFWPTFIKQNMRVLNFSGIILITILISAGFLGSIWMRSQVENAGYVYCRNASGISALAKTLVYTKNLEICEDLVASKRISRR